MNWLKAAAQAILPKQTTGAKQGTWVYTPLPPVAQAQLDPRSSAWCEPYRANLSNTQAALDHPIPWSMYFDGISGGFTFGGIRQGGIRQGREWFSPGQQIIANPIGILERVVSP